LTLAGDISVFVGQLAVMLAIFKRGGPEWFFHGECPVRTCLNQLKRLSDLSGSESPDTAARRAMENTGR
jgi:hypothetical protein